MSEHRFVCPCGQPLSCDDSLLGKEIACPTCGTMLVMGTKFLHFYFVFNIKYIDYKQVASGLVIVFYCNWKNIVLRWFGLVLCGYSTKMANNGK